MKKFCVLVLFLVSARISFAQSNRYQIHFQPSGDNGFFVTILLDSQTGKTWQLGKTDSLEVSFSYGAPYVIQPTSYYIWKPILIQTYPSQMPGNYYVFPVTPKK